MRILWEISPNTLLAINFNKIIKWNVSKQLNRKFGDGFVRAAVYNSSFFDKIEIGIQFGEKKIVKIWKLENCKNSVD